ncbi:MAG: nucleotidyltransferase domain-containing protein [Candidatus Vogelbacteria bacterium]|nr:nucleotidyltransferase domain-containing protein [Candidatus Vogelbacteria bacterium]
MIEIDRERIKAIAEKHGLEFVVLFGSQATGQTHPKSDVDLAYFPPRSFSFGQESKLHLDIVETVRKHEIDLINLKSASSLLLKQVIDRCSLLYEKHRGSFNEFVLYVFRIYDETAPLRRLEKEYVLAKTRDYALQLGQ